VVPAVVSPNGQCLAGNSWNDEFQLPSHRTNPDGSQGTAFDWSSSTFTVTSSAPVTVTPSGLSGSTPTVTVSLTATQTGELTGYTFTYYLRETPNFAGDAFLKRTVQVNQP